MADFEVREEVLNVLLAEHLQDRGLLSVPEAIIRAARGRQRRLPDVTIADLWGLRVTIEGRFDESVVDLARSRVEEGISPICLAVCYPADLRGADSMPTLKRRLGRARLQVRVISERDDGDWADATVDDLAEILRRSYELLVGEDVVSSAVEQLTHAIDFATGIITVSPASPARIRDLLGIPAEATPAGEDGDE